MPLVIGQLLNSRYQIEQQIGHGGSGAVYRAYDTILERDCAIKENLDLSPEAQRQFEREARILAPLRHPSLPRVFDQFAIPEQGQYLVMDFVKGRSLADILLKQGHARNHCFRPIPEVQVLDWIGQICQALIYLHQQNPPVIHRDIKPANIIRTPSNQAVLVDFGISKVYTTGHHTTLGARRVTPGYTPPEQYGYGRTDARSDIYALGATIYVLLTGQRPPESIERLTNHTPLTRPIDLNHTISPHIEQVLLKALEPTATARFQSVEEFQRHLFVQHRSTISLSSHPLSQDQTTPQHQSPRLQDQAPLNIPLDQQPPREHQSGPISVTTNASLWPKVILFLLGLIGSIVFVLVLGLTIGRWVIGTIDTPTPTLSAPSSGIQPTPTLVIVSIDPTALPSATPSPNSGIRDTLGSTSTSSDVEPTLISTLIVFSVTPTQTSTPNITLSPSPTQNCLRTPQGRFALVWQSYQHLLGCPLGDLTVIPTIAEEIFEGGHLFWRSDVDEMYIIYDRSKASGLALFEGRWENNPPARKWDDSAPDGIGLNPPPGFVEPKRGFGWLWRTHLGRENGPLGWALDHEYGFDNLALSQTFEQGLIFKGSSPKIYILLTDERFFAE